MSPARSIPERSFKPSSEELAEGIHHSLASVVTNLVARHAPRGRPNAWDLYGLDASLAATCPLGLRREERNLKSPSSAGLQTLLIGDIERAWAASEAGHDPKR
jgi:hypothetical protein